MQGRHPVFPNGEGTKIADEIIPDVTRRPEALRAAADAWKALSDSLTHANKASGRACGLTNPLGAAAAATAQRPVCRDAKLPFYFP